MNARHQAISQLGFEEGFFKQAALLGIPEEIAKQAAYGDLGVLGGIGQGIKYGLRGPVAAVAAPFMYPISAWQSGGGIAGTQEALSQMPESAPNMLGGQGLAHMVHPSTAALLRRVNEVREASPELAAQFEDYIKNQQEGTGTSGTAAATYAGMAGLSHLAGLGTHILPAMLGSGVAGAGGQARFAEGLGGDQAGMARRLFDPVGYSTKNIAYELAKKDPELAARMLAALQAKFK